MSVPSVRLLVRPLCPCVRSNLVHVPSSTQYAVDQRFQLSAGLGRSNDMQPRPRRRSSDHINETGGYNTQHTIYSTALLPFLFSLFGEFPNLRKGLVLSNARMHKRHHTGIFSNGFTRKLTCSQKKPNNIEKLMQVQRQRNEWRRTE